MKHIWSVLCRFSIVDDQRNNISLIEVLEEITFQSEVEINEDQVVPLPIAVEVVSFWSRSSPDQRESARARVVILSPGGKPVGGGNEYSIDLTEFRRFRSRVNVLGLPYAGNGTYRFLVQYFDEAENGWRDAAAIPLEISRELPPE